MKQEYKGYVVSKDQSGFYYHVRYPGKGSVDLSLRGMYTSPKEAEKAIDAFLDKPKVEEKKDAQAVPAS